MIDVPEGATYKWTPNDDYYNPIVKRLHYYRKAEDSDDWMVYSDITGWRYSQNTDDWFETEIQKGYFKKINE